MKERGKGGGENLFFFSPFFAGQEEEKKGKRGKGESGSLSLSLSLWPQFGKKRGKKKKAHV